MCEKKEYTLLDNLLIELVSLAAQLRTARTVQSCFDSQMKILRSYAPEVLEEILWFTTEPETETLDVEFEYV